MDGCCSADRRVSMGGGQDMLFRLTMTNTSGGDKCRAPQRVASQSRHQPGVSDKTQRGPRARGAFNWRRGLRCEPPRLRQRSIFLQRSCGDAADRNRDPVMEVTGLITATPSRRRCQSYGAQLKRWEGIMVWEQTRGAGRTEDVDQFPAPVAGTHGTLAANFRLVLVISRLVFFVVRDPGCLFLRQALPGRTCHWSRSPKKHGVLNGRNQQRRLSP